MKITKRSKTIRASQFTIRKKITAADELENGEFDLEQSDQEFTSKDTSINSTKLPAIYKLVDFPEGSLVLDYGGGKFDNATEWLAEQNVKGLVYDPYNRTAEHNREVVREIRANGGADITLCSNVLNVIKEPEARLTVLKNIRKLTKPSGKIYITVYEGKGTGEGKQSKKDSYQLNRKTADYLDEVHLVFPDAERKGKLIFATPAGEVNASCNSAADIENPRWFNVKNSVESAEKTYDKSRFINKLKEELHHELVETLTNSKFGFPEDEIDQYSYIDIRDSIDGVMVEVRSELSYDSMSELAEALDPIIEKYDKDAYFDQEDPGIMNTFLKIKFKGDITSAEEIDYDERIDANKLYTYEFDFNVEVTDDGTDLNDSDAYFPEIYDEDYDFIVEDDTDYIIENLLSLVDYNIPEDPGTYRVSGIAKLRYLLDDIYVDYDDDSYDVSSASADFDYKGSWVENLQVQKLS